MKRIFSVLLALLLLTVPGTVSADNENGNIVRIKTKLEEKVQAREEKLQQIQANVQNRVQQRIASREAKLSQLKQNLVKRYYEQMSKRMWATTERLETLVSRIESRIAAVDTETDKDLSAIRTDVEKAKALLSDTKVLLTSSDSMINSVLDSNSPKEAFEILKSNIADIKTNLKEVHKLLVKVVGDISGLRVGNYNVTPTVTPKAV